MRLSLAKHVHKKQTNKLKQTNKHACTQEQRGGEVGVGDPEFASPPHRPGSSPPGAASRGKGSGGIRGRCRSGTRDTNHLLVLGQGQVVLAHSHNEDDSRDALKAVDPLLTL